LINGALDQLQFERGGDLIVSSDVLAWSGVFAHRLNSHGLLIAREDPEMFVQPFLPYLFVAVDAPAVVDHFHDCGLGRVIGGTTGRERSFFPLMRNIQIILGHWWSLFLHLIAGYL